MREERLPWKNSLSGEALSLPRAKAQFHKMALYFVNTQPYLEFPVIEQSLQLAGLRKQQSTDSSLKSKYSSDDKIRFIAGIQMEGEKTLQLTAVSIKTDFEAFIGQLFTPNEPKLCS